MKMKQTMVRRGALNLAALMLLVGVPARTYGATAISSVPYAITSSGSYYLAKDLRTTVADQNAITVEANDVTIDLMGYSLIGYGSGAGSGIVMQARENVEVRNGSVQRFGGYGIFEAKFWSEESPTCGYGHRVIGVRTLYNGSYGIDLEGYNHLVKDCTAMQNGKDGIYIGHSSMASGNVSNANGNDGIGLGDGCLVFNNVVAFNTYYGIWSWDGCTVSDNTSYSNKYGIYVEGTGAWIKGNTVRGCELANIYVKGTKNAMEGNLVTGSTGGSGIYFETSGNFYSNNRASGNKTNYSGPGKPTGAPGDGGGNVGF